MRNPGGRTANLSSTEEHLFKENMRSTQAISMLYLHWTCQSLGPFGVFSKAFDTPNARLHPSSLSQAVWNKPPQFPGHALSRFALGGQVAVDIFAAVAADRHSVSTDGRTFLHLDFVSLRIIVGTWT